jgi:hypothetical protein
MLLGKFQNVFCMQLKNKARRLFLKGKPMSWLKLIVIETTCNPF